MYRVAGARRVVRSIVESGTSFGGTPRLRARVLAAVAAAGCALAATSAASAKPETVNASGTGAAASFQSSGVVAGTPVAISAFVFVSTPSDSSQAASVSVSVTETDALTGAVRFAGTGSGTPESFAVQTDLSSAHLQGEVTATSATGATRLVELNVVWNADGDGDSISLNLNGRKATTGFLSERHEGTTLLATATGVVTSSDPAVSGHVITVNSPAPGAIWQTTDTGKLETVVGSSATTAGGASATSIGSTATTTGYWKGYWTWNTVTKTWIWTWVWVAPTGTWTSS